MASRGSSRHLHLTPNAYKLSRRVSYALVATLVSLGAPVGLVALWWFTRTDRGLGTPSGLFIRDVPTFLYVTLSTLAAFAIFGYVIGRHADALADLSRTDSLTGLRNQRAFDERLEEEVARAGRYGAPLSLLIVDIDGLKAINDQGGHDAGNAALRAVATALRQGARQSDMAARIGGDEFAVIAPSTDGHAAVALGERIRSLAAGTSGTGGVTVSVGLATLEHDGVAASTLLRAADRALYDAKRNGRNCVASARPVWAVQ